MKRKYPKRVYELFKLMPPVRGERRGVYRCDECKQLFGRRYIPYGIGRGMTVDPCLCMLTHRTKYTKVAERRP